MTLSFWTEASQVIFLCILGVVTLTVWWRRSASDRVSSRTRSTATSQYDGAVRVQKRREIAEFFTRRRGR